MSALYALKAALAASASANGLSKQEAYRQALFLDTAARYNKERHDLENVAAEREADALVAGQPVPEAPLAEARRLIKLEREARAAEAAARKVGVSIAGPIASRQRAARADLTDASLFASRDIRDAALSAFQAALGELVPHLADMIAAQSLRERFAGPTFEFDGARHPPVELWASARTARKFVGSLPSRFRAADFADRVEAEAEARFKALLVELEMA